jgi:Ca2+-dependent lipid-binding protein
VKIDWYSLYMNYPDAAEYTFAGLAIGSLISFALGYQGFGIEALMPVILCTIGAYYYGKSKSEKPK